MLPIQAESGPKVMPCIGHALPLSCNLLLPPRTSHEGWECGMKTGQRDKWHCSSGRYRSCTPASSWQSNYCSFTSQITPVGSKSPIPSAFPESWASRSPKEGKYKQLASPAHVYTSLALHKLVPNQLTEQGGGLSLAALLSVNLQNNSSGMITQSKWKTQPCILHCCGASLFEGAKSLA